jgi:uncharacterized membrane protein
MNKLLTSAALISIAATIASSASADEIKCFGISVAGKNDCNHFYGAHSCAGKATSSYDPGDWVYSPDALNCKKSCGSPDKPGEPDAQLCNNPGSGNDTGKQMRVMPIPEL